MSDIDDAFNVDPTPDGPDEEANEKALQTKLKEYRLALEQEWETDTEFREGKLAPEQIRDKTKELLTQAVPKAVASLLYLSQHAGNEGVRLKASQYIVDKAIGKEIGGLVGDPLDQLLASLNKSD